MLSLILAHETTLLTFQVVLIVLGLNAVVKILMNLRNTTGESLVTALTRPVLMEIFPLILISLFAAVDPTHVIVWIFYYLTALAMVIKALLDLAGLLRK